MSALRQTRNSILKHINPTTKPLLSTQLKYRSISSTTTNMSSTDQSHATGGSKVPQTAQEKLPRGVEENVPNTIHDTGSTGSKSHATGDSIVPKPIQEAVPKKVEEILPDAIHDTSAKPKGGL